MNVSKFHSPHPSSRLKFRKTAANCPEPPHTECRPEDTIQSEAALPQHRRHRSRRDNYWDAVGWPARTGSAGDRLSMCPSCADTAARLFRQCRISATDRSSHSPRFAASRARARSTLLLRESYDLKFFRIMCCARGPLNVALHATAICDLDFFP